MTLEDRLRKAMGGRRDAVPGGDCPGPEALAAFVSGNRRKEIIEHLSHCASCREDVIVARARIGPRHALPLAWIAAAAAALFAIAIGMALFSGNREPEPIVVKPAPSPKLAPKPETPRPPEPPSFVKPGPAPETPKPAPKPEEKPAPKPAPPKEPEKPVIAKPPKEPETPKPVPKPEEKPTAELTKAKIRGTLLAIAGGCATQAEGESAWQTAKLAQPREFSGSVKLRVETTAVKARIGAATLYVRGGTELAVALEEGVTTVRLAKGEAFFDVTPGKDSFIVETATCKTAVKGTRFLILPTEVVVQRGKVEFSSGERTVAVNAGERSASAQAPEKLDVAKLLAWTRPLDETITIEAETMALAQGMTILPDPAASGGRAIGLKGPLPASAEPSAEIRVKRKQAAPYAVWVRVHWSHGVAPGFTVQVHEAHPWSGKDVVSKPGWQWVRVGTFDLPDDAFRVRIVDPQGGLRVDQVLLTSDPELNPESK